MMNARKFEPKGDLAIKPEAVGLTWPRAPQEWTKKGSVAVVSISGPLEHKGGWWFDSYQSILDRFEGAMRDEEVTGVLLKIDSPGGEVSGLQECVRRMRAMRIEFDKPVVAYADDEAYSAAYALACAADEIYLPEAGGLGSIGVLASVCDRTKMTEKMGLRIEVVRSGPLKADGHPDIPLSDETLSRVQVRVDQLAGQFFALVAEVRPVSKKKLAALQGATVCGQAAVDAGLADGLSSFDEVLAAMSAETEFDNTGSEAVEINTTDQSAGRPEGHPEGSSAMKLFAPLQKKVDATLAAVIAAKSPAARKVASAAHAKAVAALTEAKVKKDYKKKTTTTEEETESDDGEAEETEDEETDEKDPPSDGDDDDDDKDDDDDSEDEEDEEEDEESKKMKKGKKAAASASLSSFVKSLTGQTSTRSAKQVLASMHEQAQLAVANAEEIAKLKATATKNRVAELVNAGVAAGQIKPAQLAWARTQTAAQLKAFLAATPAMFAPRPPPMPGASEDQGGDGSEVPGTDGMTAKEHEICRITGVSPDAYKKQRAIATGAPLPKVN